MGELMSSTDLEVFDVEQRTNGWVREITFFFRGKRGRMFIAFEESTGYTNCEILDYPSFENDEDAGAFEEFWDNYEAWQWDERTANFEKEA
jgi:hypothetical protein